MKKKNLKLFLIFGVMILLIALVGCQTDEAPEVQSDTAEEKTTTNEIAEQSKATEQSEAEEESEQTTDILSEELISSLVEYMEQMKYDHEIADTSFEIRINRIKNGENAYRITFDRSDFYYACAYYDEYHECERVDHCCVSEYTWVKICKPEDITEYYEGKSLVVAFQINRSEICENILSGEVNVKAEHFQIYSVKYADGRNVAAPIDFNKYNSFVFLDLSKNKTLYLTVYTPRHELNSFPCVILEDQCYITRLLSIQYEDGSRSVDETDWDFGIYYDALTEIMITDKYSVKDDYGRTINYGLFDVKKFAEIINCIKEDTP